MNKLLISISSMIAFAITGVSTLPIPTVDIAILVFILGFINVGIVTWLGNTITTLKAPRE